MYVCECGGDIMNGCACVRLCLCLRLRQIRGAAEAVVVFDIAARN